MQLVFNWTEETVEEDVIETKNTETKKTKRCKLEKEGDRQV